MAPDVRPAGQAPAAAGQGCTAATTAALTTAVGLSPDALPHLWHHSKPPCHQVCTDPASGLAGDGARLQRGDGGRCEREARQHWVPWAPSICGPIHRLCCAHRARRFRPALQTTTSLCPHASSTGGHAYGFRCPVIACLTNLVDCSATPPHRPPARLAAHCALASAPIAHSNAGCLTSFTSTSC